MITKRRVKDLVERIVLTFVGAFVAIYIAAFAAGDADIAFLKDPNLFNKAGTAGIAALVPLVSGLVGFRVGDKQSASVVPSNKSEPVEEPNQYVYVDNPDDEIGDFH